MQFIGGKSINKKKRGEQKSKSRAMLADLTRVNTTGTMAKKTKNGYREDSPDDPRASEESAR